MTTTQLMEVLLMIQRFWTSQFSSQVCRILKSSKSLPLKNKAIVWAPLSTISDGVMFLVVEFLQLLPWYLYVVLEKLLIPMWNIRKVVSNPVNARRNNICRDSSSPSLLCIIYNYIWLHFWILYLSGSTLFKELYPFQRHFLFDERNSHIRSVFPPI